jgi:predicted TPR repeat methyltransferase
MAADAVVYVPDIVPLALEAARVLKPKGLLAFTVETHRGAGVVLGDGLRYAHSSDYLRDVLEQAKLIVSDISSATTRMEAGDPVPGLVVTASKP